MRRTHQKRKQARPVGKRQRPQAEGMPSVEPLAATPASSSGDDAFQAQPTASGHPEQPAPAVPPSPAPETAPIPARVTETDADAAPPVWRACGEAIMGLAHRRKHLPCQDAVAWRNALRPILVLSDGAGSAPVSERGAQALVVGITRLLSTLENDLAGWLDRDAPPPSGQSHSWAERLRLHAQGLLEDIAQAERRSVRDFRATLLVAVIGRVSSFWWQVGDGAIVARQDGALHMLGEPARNKGEFANQTCFVDSAAATDVQWGLLPSDTLSGMVLMSDGGAERLVLTDGKQVASRLNQWLQDLQNGQLTPDRLAVAFHEPALWERTSLDDRAIVLAARAPRSGGTTTAT